MTEKKLGSLAVLKKFFGYRPEDDLKGFKAECDALSDTDKLELAQLAAAELKLSADELNFQLI